MMRGGARGYVVRSAAHDETPLSGGLVDQLDDGSVWPEGLFPFPILNKLHSLQQSYPPDVADERETLFKCLKPDADPLLPIPRPLAMAFLSSISLRTA